MIFPQLTAVRLALHTLFVLEFVPFELGIALVGMAVVMWPTRQFPSPIDEENQRMHLPLCLGFR